MTLRMKDKMTVSLIYTKYEIVIIIVLTLSIVEMSLYSLLVLLTNRLIILVAVKCCAKAVRNSKIIRKLLVSFVIVSLLKNVGVGLKWHDYSNLSTLDYFQLIAQVMLASADDSVHGQVYLHRTCFKYDNALNDLKI